VSSFAEDLPLSAAGVAQGHLAFQEFLLAGERHIVGGFTRPGAEEGFARFYSKLPDSTQSMLAGYFRRQSQLDISQRVSLLGPFVKLDISNPLRHGRIRQISPPPASIRSELDSLGARRFDGRGAAFKVIKGATADAIADTGDQKVKPLPGKPGVRFIELLLNEVAVEDSQDYTFLIKNDTDEVTLGLTMLSEVGVVTTAAHNLGSIEEGHSKKYATPLVLGSIPVSTSIKGFPRAYSFKVDAVDRDDGTYNDLLEKGADYIQELVTEELIASGIMTGSGALGYPIPPAIANYIASYVKTWFDDFVDWVGDLLKDDDDILGSKSRSIVLESYAFELTERSWFLGTKTVSSEKGPLVGSPFTWTFSGADGRWRTNMSLQLR
jgi:hypothetical protein